VSDHPTIEASNRSISLIRVRPEKNEWRFYALAVDLDLFGCPLLVRHWGRLGTSGRTRLECHQSIAAALVALATLERTKRRRGYWDRNRAQSD
jgi:predicted DNA-binding WGR domain protein